MKKIIASFILLFCVLFSFAVDKKGVKQNKKKKPQIYTIVCWISEIVHHSDGTTDTWYRCKEVCTHCQWVKNEKKVELTKS